MADPKGERRQRWGMEPAYRLGTPSMLSWRSWGGQERAREGTGGGDGRETAEEAGVLLENTPWHRQDGGHDSCIWN
jgi:hypothetical protein